MQRMGDQLLAGAALTPDQYGYLERSNLDNLSAKSLDRGARPDNGFESVGS